MSLQALDLLAKGLEAQAKVDLKADDTNNSHDASLQGHQKELTHHFKVTRTTEVDVSTKEDVQDIEDKKKEKTTKKRRGCFSSCFGKPGK